MDNLFPCEVKKFETLTAENNKLAKKKVDLYCFASMLINEIVDMLADPDEAAEVFDKYTKQLDYIMNNDDVNIEIPLPGQFRFSNMD